MTETKKESPLFGCLLLFAIAFLVWAFTADWSAPDDGEAAPTQAATAPTQQVTTGAASSQASEPSPPLPTPKPQKIKRGDLDPADRAIALAINLSGNLCAKPIEVREAGTQLYAVRCITNRNGTGMSDYFVNSRTNEVKPF